MIKPLHFHQFELEQEAYGQLPKLNTPEKRIMWGRIEKCICGSRRWISPALKKLGGIGETEIH